MDTNTEIARDDGADVGTAAASWVEFPDAATALDVWRGIRDGDPEDTAWPVRPPDLSGEMAGDSIPEIADRGGWEPTPDALDAWEASAADAFWAAVERAAYRAARIDPADAVDYFRTGYRDNGETYVCLTDDAPDWLRDAVHDAHGDSLPDDWTYAACESAVRDMAETAGLMPDPEPVDVDAWEPTEWADMAADVYTGRLLAWLADDIGRAEYVEQAVTDYGLFSDGEQFSLSTAIMAGQTAALAAIGESIRSAFAEIREA